MLVFVAQSGKSLEVAVEPTTRVATLMETLTTVVNVLPSDQILMSNGCRLDPSRALSAYTLPGPAGERDVFLYNKSNLRTEATGVQDEPATPLQVQEPSDQPQLGPLLLDVGAPLEGSLSQYEHQFRLQHEVALAGLQAADQRFGHCSALVSEMEVQSRAVDSARTNVETHYTHIHNQIAGFTRQYAEQRRVHADFLSGFEAELQALEAVSLHPAVQSTRLTRLIDLLDTACLRQQAAECSACHHSLTQKVASVEGLFTGLRADVEAVFMQGPSVQLEALATRLQALQPHLQELESIVQVLERDKAQIRRLSSSGVQKAGGLGGASPADTCHLMETMHDNHTQHILPRVTHYRALFESFYARCLDDKKQMTRDAAAQLRRISSQQMTIQSIRNKLAAFQEVATKESDMFARLLLVRQIPAAYRQCLAECVRRQAFAELCAGQAQQMAERMGKLREKEREMRDGFLEQVQPYIPATLLEGLALLQQPPHCQISLPSQPGSTPSVSLADLRAVPLHQSLTVAASDRDAASSGADESEAAGSAAEFSDIKALEMENAGLRGELAVLLAEECLRCRSEQATGELQTGATLNSLAEEDVRKFRSALAAKQEVVLRLQRLLAQAHQQSASYESRIHSLESQLAVLAAELYSSKQNATALPGTTARRSSDSPETLASTRSRDDLSPTPQLGPVSSAPADAVS